MSRRQHPEWGSDEFEAQVLAAEADAEDRAPRRISELAGEPWPEMVVPDREPHSDRREP